MTGPVLDMPASPSGWEESSAQLVRIIDPLGEAIAWFAPEFGGCCAGYAVRQAGDLARDRAAWRDIIVGSRSMPSVVLREGQGGTNASRWRFVERDPALCTMDWTPHDAQGECWQTTASITDGQLSLAIRVQNTGSLPIQTAIRLRLVLASIPGIAIRSVISVHDHDADTHRGGGLTFREQQDGTALIVESSPNTSTVLIEPVGNEVFCTIADYQVQDAPPVIQPDAYRYLSILIGPQ